MSEFISMTKVYIIESPSFIDIIDNRKEVDALSQIWNLSKIALSRISDNVNLIKGDLGAVHIHFSLHGSKDGVQISKNTFNFISLKKLYHTSQNHEKFHSSL